MIIRMVISYVSVYANSNIRLSILNYSTALMVKQVQVISSKEPIKVYLLSTSLFKDMNRCAHKLASKNNIKTSIFHPSKLGGKRYIKMTKIFCSSKKLRRKYVETTSIFRSSKLRQTKYVEMMLISYSSKFCKRIYVKVTSSFCSSKLH